MDFTVDNSSSLTIGERICVAFIPFVAVVKALIMPVCNCFDYQPCCDNRLHHNIEVSRLSDETNFSVDEVEALYELFKKLSSSIIDDGFIQKEELQFALFRTTSGNNLILDQVFNIFDENKKGVLGFEEFVHSLNIFHPHASIEAKIDFAFRLFDLRDTGYIERVEVKQMVIAILMESDTTLSDELLEAILDKTFADVGEVNKDGRINRKEWDGFMLKHPSLLNHMTLPYLKDVTTAFPSFVFTNYEIED